MVPRIVPGYAALLALMYIYLAIRVMMARRDAGVSIGSGGNRMLERRIRVHGNFAEYVPIALILLVLMEMRGSAPWLSPHAVPGARHRARGACLGRRAGARRSARPRRRHAADHAGHYPRRADAPRERAIGGGMAVEPGDARLAARLKGALKGEVLFDGFTRGRYSTDASIYQIEPLGVVVPRDAADIEAALAIAREEGVPVLPRGGGTSQCGQAVNRALVIDCSKHMTAVLALDEGARRVTVEPGVVLERLNASLKSKGLFFPVDISTGSRATIGGMTANNSCGARSLRYGNMVHNVRAIDAILADGTAARFGEVARQFRREPSAPRATARWCSDARAPPPRGRRDRGALPQAAAPGRRLQHRHDRRCRPQHGASPGGLGGHARLLHRDRARSAADPAAQGPGHLPLPEFLSRDGGDQGDRRARARRAVELVDRTMIELARDIPMFRPTVERFVRGEPEALLLVEFAGEDADDNAAACADLVELMGDLGFPGAVIEATDPAFQSAVWEVRAARPQHHDVDEGRREAGLLHRGLRRAAR